LIREGFLLQREVSMTNFAVTKSVSLRRNSIIKGLEKLDTNALFYKINKRMVTTEDYVKWS
jgi:hypothetical protein